VILNMKRLILTTAVLSLAVAPARAQTAADSAAIKATALDYIEGWYTADAERMERAVHPDLAKRIINTNPANGRSLLGHQSAMTLVQGTKRGGGKDAPGAKRKDVRILDIFGNTASVKVDADTWVDYLHIAKFNGRWVIINVLWEMRPQQ
jgi:hypothetical protein